MKQVTIQTNVPICPNCHGGLRYNKIAQKYICTSCYSGFKVIDIGSNEREFICEATNKNVDKNE